MASRVQRADDATGAFRTRRQRREFEDTLPDDSRPRPKTGAKVLRGPRKDDKAIRSRRSDEATGAFWTRRQRREFQDTLPDDSRPRRKINAKLPSRTRKDDNLTGPRYRYSPLLGDTIRLLQLLPNSDDKAEIGCQLVDHRLSGTDEGAHPYEALSYVWGSQGPLQTMWVGAGREPLRVTKNLDAALRRLRHGSLIRTLWVDSVCINQEDAEEKCRQIRLMAKIYAHARCVVVWLEEAVDGRHATETTDSGWALDKLLWHAAANISGDGGAARSTPSGLLQLPGLSGRKPQVLSSAGALDATSSGSGSDLRRAVRLLLERSWFHRIWVLQEVAAARHVIVTSRSTEIDGYAFCLGLEAALRSASLRGTWLETDLENMARSAVYLIGASVVRDRRVKSRSDRFSLDVCSLAELLDLYHDRSATDQRDKVFALLGMSSDDKIPDSLLPQTDVTWRELFSRLVRSLVGQEANVQTWDTEELAVANTRGRILGLVSELGPKTAAVHALPNSIQGTDVVCLFCGASVPAVVRPYRDYWAVVALGGVSLQDGASALRQNPARNVLLVWDWEQRPGGGGVGNHVNKFQGFVHGRLDKHPGVQLLQSSPGAASRLMDMALVRADLDQEEHAYEDFRDAARRLPRELNGGLLNRVLSVAKSLAQRCISPLGDRFQVMIDIFDRRGGFAHPGADQLLRAAQSSVGATELLFRSWSPEGNVVTDAVLEATARLEQRGVLELMRLLLKKRANSSGKDTTPLTIVSAVLLAAARNKRYGDSLLLSILNHYDAHVEITSETIEAMVVEATEQTMKQLLDRFGRQVQIKAAALEAAASRATPGMMKLLLDHLKPRFGITERVLQAVARNQNHGSDLMRLLLAQCPHEVNVTEGVVETAAAEGRSGLMDFLLKKFPDQVRATEQVVTAAAGNKMDGCAMMGLLLTSRGLPVAITARVVKAAVSNGYSMMELLFHIRDTQIDITEDEDIITLAASHEIDGPKLMELMFKRRGTTFEVTEKALQAAARNKGRGVSLMRLLLDERGSALPMTDNVVAAAVANEIGGHELLDLFFSRRVQVRMTESVMIAAAGNEAHGYQLMVSLFRNCAFQEAVTPGVWKAAAGNKRWAKELKSLFDQKKQKKGDSGQEPEH
ncbi:heterokaryon incompatibility protein-domain-containing protein [Echria macrotheca]|uniref:Heterokaryon incompatibility protein-domain-containing protein n=1 Tax=Echria macrotheca TaxID=438768 RepID=A0AAJ0F7N7_9PEZI|nr:heterokaryon incompatibility protein-domain-containing protein [Echria macrotheca]